MSIPHGAVGCSAVYAIVIFIGNAYLLFGQNKWRTDSKVAPKTYVVGNQKNRLNPNKPCVLYMGNRQTVGPRSEYAASDQVQHC